MTTSEELASELALKRADALVRLSDSTTALTNATLELRKDVHEIKTTRRIDQIKLILLIVAIFINTGVAAFAVAGYNGNSKVLNKINCIVDPTGTCSLAAQGRAQQTRILQEVQLSENLTIVYAIECARQVPNGAPPITSFQQCIQTGVDSGLKAKGF